MAKPGPDLIKELEKKGFRSFVILFTWEFCDDDEAARKMFQLHENLESEGIRGGHGWYLTGKRTMIIIGWTDSNLSLQKLCLSVTRNTGINADVCYGIDIHDLASIVSMPPVKAE